MIVGKKLYDYFKEHGIDMMFVAKKCGMKYELLRRSLRGQRDLEADELVAILQAFDIDLNVLMKGEQLWKQQ